MQKRIAIIMMLLALGTLALPAFQALRVKAESPGMPQQTAQVNEGGAELPDMARRRAEFFFKQRAFPFGVIPADWRLKALEHIRKYMPEVGPQALALRALAPLTPLGPAPIANGQTFGIRQDVTGRVTALALDPQNPNIVYLGAAQGGLWRSTDAGQTWEPLTDSAPTQATGAIAIDPTNPNIIYMGTGEGNFSGDSFFGMGILKSTDGGQTWTNLAAETFVGRSINQLLIDPRTPSTLYAAVGSGIAGIDGSIAPERARNGIYKSTDGGVTWTNVLQVAPSNAPLGFTAFDIEMDPTNSSVLYAAINMQGIFKTTDAGRNWVKLTNGLPTTGFGRPEIAIARSNPNILYAAFEDSSTGDLLNLFKSSNGGSTWSKMKRPPRTIFDNICQCSYDNIVEIDPTNPNVVYFGGVSLYKSANGGRSWTDIGKRDIGLHPDIQAMVLVPGNPSQFYVGTDGGVWSSSDGGSTFVNRNDSLNITQFNSISMHPTNPNIALGGTQDNGTNLFVGAMTWPHADDGDGGFSAIDQTRPNVMYHTYFFSSLVRSTQGGRLGTWANANSGINQNDAVLFYPPFILDPNNQSTLYFGTFRLYRSTNQASNWTPISGSLTGGGMGEAISAIAVAPGAPQVIYTGSSDGAVFTSQNGGVIFQNVTGNLPLRYISDIVVDPNVPTTVYVSLSGFRSGHVFKSITGGGNWQDISGNLPDVPANALVINPLDSLNLFLGTDMGLFETSDGGATWVLVPGMPMVSVFDIAINATLGLVRVATHGRGVYEMNLPEGTTTPTVKMTAPKAPKFKEAVKDQKGFPAEVRFYRSPTARSL